MTDQRAARTYPPARAGEVYDLGFQRYEGPREGRWRARRAIWVDGIRAALALGRPARQKLLPFGMIGMALVPALVIVSVIGFLASRGIDEALFAELANRGYYEFALFPLMLYTATLAPELLVPDRRSRVIVLYLVRPLTPLDYAASRWAAFFTVSLAVLWIPQILIYLTHFLGAASIDQFLRDHGDVAPRALAAGVVMAAFLTTAGLAISSLTDRRAYAAAGVIALFLISAVLSGIGAAVLPGAAAEVARLANLPGAALTTNDWIFGAADGAAWRRAAVVAATVLGGWVLLWARYRKLTA